MNNRENIILVLKESIKIGKEVDFIYHKMSEKHKEVSTILNFTSTMKKKMELFENLDEKSYTFQRILDTAKIACSNLQRGDGYNYHCAELILKFNQLEDIFKKKLVSKGVREPEVKEKKKVVRYTSDSLTDDDKDEEINILTDEDGNEYEEVIPITRDAKYLKSNISGKKLTLEIKKQEEITTTLREATFSE